MHSPVRHLLKKNMVNRFLCLHLAGKYPQGIYEVLARKTDIEPFKAFESEVRVILNLLLPFRNLIKKLLVKFTLLSRNAVNLSIFILLLPGCTT